VENLRKNLKMRITTVNNHEKKETLAKPYARYKIDGEVHDKGGAYAVKIAILNHIKNRNLNWRLINFVPTSRNISALLEISDYTQLNIDIPELLHAINESGRQPSKPAYRAKLTIEPVPFEAYVENEIRQQYEEQLDKKECCIQALTQTCEEQQKKIGEKEKQYGKLEESCKEHQLFLVGKDQKISFLESELEKTPKAKFNNSWSAILEGYLGNNETVYEVIEDYNLLKKNSDVEAFLRISQKEAPTRIDYFNAKFNLNLSSEQEFSEKIKQENISWYQTEQGKELLELKRRHNNDQSLISLVEISGVSEEMIFAIRSVTEQKLLEKVSAALESYQQEHENEQKFCVRLKKSQETYTSFQEVYERSLERRKRNAEIPLIVRSSSSPVTFKIYAPCIDKEFGLQEPLQEMMQRTIGPRINAPLIANQYSNSVLEFVLPLETFPQSRPTRIHKEISSICSNNPFWRSLGVKLRIDHLLGSYP